MGGAVETRKNPDVDGGYAWAILAGKHLKTITLFLKKNVVAFYTVHLWYVLI